MMHNRATRTSRWGFFHGRMMVAAIALVASPASAHAGTTLTLADAEAVALTNHPLIHGAASDVEAAEQAIKIARAPLFPQLDLNAVQAFADKNSRIAAPAGLNDPTVIDRGSFGVALTQQITDFGRTASEEAASRSEAVATIRQGDLTRAIVILNVAQAYYGALDAAGLMELAKETLRQRQVLLDQIAALARAKLKSSLDQSIAAGDVDEAKQFLIDAVARHDSALATLSQAMGYADDREFVPEPPTLIPPVARPLADYTQAALDQNPELQALKAKQEAARQRAEAARKAFYPEIDAVGYAGATPEIGDGQSIDHSYAVGGVVLSVPLFTGGALSGEAHRMAAQAASLSDQVEDLRNRLSRDVHTTFDDVRASYDNIAVTRALLSNADQTLRLTRARYQIGASSIVDLSEAQLRRTQAAISNTDATYRYLLKLAALDFLTGDKSPP